MHCETRQLRDLVSVGPAMLKDFELLGISSVAQLRRRSPRRMYQELCRLWSATRSLLLGCFCRRSGAGKGSRTPARAMSMVVLEQSAEE